jgi:outer membrane protein TolC
MDPDMSIWNMGKRVAAGALLSALLLGGLLPGAVSGAETGGIPLYTLSEARVKAVAVAPEIVKQKAAIDSAIVSKNSAASTLDSARANAFYSSATDVNENDTLTNQIINAADAYDNAADNVDDEREKLENLERQIAYNVEKLYLDILNSQTGIQLQEKSLEASEKNLDLTTLKVQLGLAAQTELDTENQAYKNAVNQWEIAKTTLNNLKLNMNAYLGMAAGAPFELAAAELGQVNYDPAPGSLQSKALENALSLRQADRSIDAINKKIDQITDTSQEDQRDTLASQARTAVLNRDQTETNLINAVTAAYTKLDQAGKTLDLNEAKLDSAKKDYEKKALQETLGLIPATQLTQSQNTLAQAENDCVQARYNVYLAQRALELLAYGITV